MEIVLSIDASINPARAVLARVGEGRVEVIRTYEADLSELHRTAAPLPADVELESGAAPEIRPAAVTASPLEALLQSITEPWSTAILIVAPPEYLSLNLVLPFRDERSVAKVIDLEVQDVVPFDVQDFLIDHHLLAAVNGSSSDVYVGMTPRSFIAQLLAACRNSEFEPHLVVPPNSALATFLTLGAVYFPDDCVLILAQPPRYGCVIRIDGHPRFDRGFVRPSGLTDDDWLQQLGRELRLTLASAERRYGRQIQRMFCLGDAQIVRSLEGIISRPVERLDVREFIPSADQSGGIAEAAALLAVDEEAPRPLVNFRVREFASRPQLKLFLRAARAVWPRLAVALTAFIVACLTIYVVRARTLTSTRAAMRAEVVSLLGASRPIAENDEVASLSRAASELEEQLKGLGSLSQFTPLDALRAVSEDLPMERGITSINRFSMRENRLTIEGTGRDYAAVDAVERAFKEHKDIYCRVKVESSGGAAGRQSTQVDFTVNTFPCGE